MKLFKRLFGLVMILVLLAGCTMKENLTMSISSDKKVKLTVLIAMDNEMIDAMLSMQNMTEDGQSSNSKTYTDAERWAYLEGDDSTLEAPEGFKAEKYDKDGFKGYIATKELGTIDELSAASAAARTNIIDESSDDMFVGTLFIKNGTKYKSNMTIDLSDTKSQLSTYQASGALFNIEVKFELPAKPISHNATSVSSDGKTLTYDLLKAENIDFEFDFNDASSTASSEKTSSTSENNSNLALYIGIGAGVLVLLVVVIVVVSKKKKSPEQNYQPAQTTEPVQAEDQNNNN